MAENSSFLKPATLVNLDHNYCDYVYKPTLDKSSDIVVEQTMTESRPSESDCKENQADKNSNPNEWQTVPSKVNKRNIDSSPNLDVKRSRATNVNSSINNQIGLVETSNSFSVLADQSNDVDDMEEENASNLKEPKTPPIFIPNVSNVKPCIDLINTLVPDNSYIFKCVNQNVIKISPSTSHVYRNIVHGLNAKKIQFHTYQLKQDRCYRVVLKNIHFSTPLEELKAEIEYNGFKVRNLVNVKSNVTKQPLSMFFVDLEPHPQNKEIFEVQYLLNCKVRFEPPLIKKEVVQCKRCQDYGHTKTYCRNNFRCVKCGQNHDTITCQKPITVPPTCALCQGEHPANYRGCPVYNKIKSKRFPELRQKSINDNTTINTESPDNEKNHFPARQVTNKVSYAQVTKETQLSNGCQQDNPGNGNVALMIQKSFERLENILVKQAEQISTLLNLLSSVVSRLK